MGWARLVLGLMALILVRRVLWFQAPSVVGGVSRACVVPGGSADSHRFACWGLSWPARFVVYSVMSVGRVRHHGRGDVQVLIRCG
jgi:hypothetical protein